MLVFTLQRTRGDVKKIWCVDAYSQRAVQHGTHLPVVLSAEAASEALLVLPVHGH